MGGGVEQVLVLIHVLGAVVMEVILADAVGDVIGVRLLAGGGGGFWRGGIGVVSGAVVVGGGAIGVDLGRWVVVGAAGGVGQGVHGFWSDDAAGEDGAGECEEEESVFFHGSGLI